MQIRGCSSLTCASETLALPSHAWQVPIPYPSDIMVRERSMLINLEAIRLIITKDQVLGRECPHPPSCMRTSQRKHH